MKMRARGQARHSDPSDDLTLLHVSARPYVGRDRAQVRVPGPDLTGMPKLHQAPVRPRESRAHDRARGGRLDWSAVGSAVIDPFVGAPALEDRVESARAEPAGDPVGNRVAGECALQRAALLVVVGVLPARRLLRNGVQDPVSVPELDRQEVAAADGSVGSHLPLERDPERIAPSQVPREVHLPGEHVGEVVDQLLEVLLPEPVEVPGQMRRPEAGLHDARDPHRVHDERDDLEPRGPERIGAHEGQNGIRVELETDPVRDAA